MQRDDGTIHATDVYETQRRVSNTVSLMILYKHNYTLCIQQTSTPIELEHVLKVTIAIII